MKWVSEFSAKWVILQQYHGKNKLHSTNDDDMMSASYKTNAKLDFYSASSLIKQTVGRHVAPLQHTILIPSQPDFAFTP
jgi:hypothetical protein